MLENGNIQFSSKEEEESFLAKVQYENKQQEEELKAKNYQRI